VSRPVDAVIKFLQSEQARGKTHVFLDDEARGGMRELFIRAKKPIEKVPSTALSVASEPAAPVLPQTIAELVIEGSDKPSKLESIKRQAANWGPARALGSLREQMVFATGNPDARIMLVGEAPSHNEEKEGQPFVGPAGLKLYEILKAMGVAREDVYICNLVKFRPATPRQTTNNRKPTPEEMAACLPLVMAEISVIRPEIIIVLGGTTAEGLLDLKGPVGSMRGTWYAILDIPVRVTYQPSYLLQTSSNEVKRALWEDMLEVMEKIGLPISEKQRRYFLPKA
jgi:uracil-DNA glycosylase